MKFRELINEIFDDQLLNSSNTALLADRMYISINKNFVIRVFPIENDHIIDNHSSNQIITGILIKGSNLLTDKTIFSERFDFNDYLADSINDNITFINNWSSDPRDSLKKNFKELLYRFIYLW